MNSYSQKTLILSRRKKDYKSKLSFLMYITRATPKLIAPNQKVRKRRGRHGIVLTNLEMLGPDVGAVPGGHLVDHVEQAVFLLVLTTTSAAPLRPRTTGGRHPCAKRQN